MLSGRIFLICAVVVAWTTAGTAAESPPSDIATTVHGDIHSGWLQQQSLPLETDFGILELPVWMLASVRFDSLGEEDRLETVDGGHLHGKVLESAFTMKRVLDAPLTINAPDLVQLRFGGRSRPEAEAGDLLELQNGDLVRVRILTAPGELVSAARDVPAGARVEVEPWEDEQGVRLVVPAGDRIEAEPDVSSVNVRWPGGESTEIPLSAVRTLAFAIPEDADLMDYLLGLDEGATFRDRLVDGGAGPRMRAVPPGSYLRGPTGEEGDSNEKPVRPVTIGKPFAIAVHEVTFDEFAAFCRATGRPQPDDSGWGRGRRPVVNVSWEEAASYAAWLGSKSGRRYRLPTEAEWEYAARAGTQSPFWWGEEPGQGRANCTGCGSYWEGERTAPVGMFPPNGFGLYDTAGNVWEWVADCYQDGYGGVPDDGSAYEQEPCGKRVIRGGAWSFPAAEARTASRWRDFPSRRSDDTGFRVVRELRPEESKALANR